MGPARGNEQYAEFDLGDQCTFGISMAPPMVGSLVALRLLSTMSMAQLAHAVELGATVALSEDGATCVTA